MNKNNMGKYPSMVQKVEDDLRSMLGELIDSIKEYFVDLDSKLKQLGVVLNE